jgi:hypothetical protein
MCGGLEKQDITQGWNKLRSEKLHDLYSPNIIRVIKSSRMICMGHAQGRRELCMTYLKGIDPF